MSSCNDLVSTIISGCLGQIEYESCGTFLLSRDQHEEPWIQTEASRFENGFTFVI